jgi:serine/threonine protein kinase
LEKGRGVSKDLKSAAFYYKSAVENGCEEAGASYQRLSKHLKNENSSDQGKRESVEPSVVQKWGPLDFGHCKEVRELGHGPSGIVRVCTKDTWKEPLAVKYFYARPIEYIEKDISRFLALNHPCIVRVLGMEMPNESSPKLRLATRIMANGSLADVLVQVKEGRAPDFWTHTNIAMTIVAMVMGMDYLHANHIVHQDLKPSNIFFDEKGRAKIGDFCASRVEDYRSVMIGRSGSALYMSPEALCTSPGSEFTYKSDVYSFGLILYEILVGESVFPRDSGIAQLMEFHLTGTHASMPAWIDPAIVNIVERCWISTPEDRPDFDEILAILEQSEFPFFGDVDVRTVKMFISDVRCQERLIASSK